MIACGVRIPHDQTEAWLEALCDQGLTVELEVPLALLAEDQAPLRKLQRSGLQVMAVRDIIDPHVGRYLEELPKKTFGQVAAAAVQAVETCREAGARRVTLELGLEHVDIARQDQDRLLQARVALLGRLCPVAEEKGITVCAPVRFPPDSPRADGLRVAANLVYDVGLESFRVCMNLFPNEMSGGLDGRKLMRQTGSLGAMVRLFYSPSLGEELEATDLRALVEALKWHGCSGGIVFCPASVDVDRIPAVCQRIEELLEVVRVGS